MNTSQPQGPLGDELTNLGIGVLLGAAMLALVLRVAGAVAAWATGIAQPVGGAASGISVLANPGNPSLALQAPGLNPLAYWLTAGVLVGGVSAAAILVWRMLRDSGRGAKPDPLRIPGIATRTDVTRAASHKALMKRATHLRPSLTHASPGDIGYRIGHSRGTAVWASVEDSILVIGPPRSGKGAHIVINAILDAPGPVITTSTRPDNLTTTLRARQRLGPVAVFDPQQLAAGIPVGLRWSPIRGCEDPLTAMIRAAGLAAGTGLAAGGVDGGGFWEAKTRTALQALLHAAALGRCPPIELFRWTLDPTAAHDAVAILLSTPAAASGWADSLQAMLEADPRTRDSIWQGVSLALSALADPRVMDAVSPGDGEGFDPEEFLHSHGTLYLLATGAGANNSAALVSAFVEDLVETARRMAARSAGARLDPPLLLALDEIGNLGRCQRSWRRAAARVSRRCRCCSRSRRRALNGATMQLAPSGTHRSSRSFSAAHPTRATCRTSRRSSASAMKPPTRQRSVIAAPVHRNARSAVSRSCRPTRSAPSHSAPASSCSARPHPSSHACACGPSAPTPKSS
ncbi:hypothetical protein HNR05_000298 [Leifsonia psychrotolerans]|uniref:Type VI secretion protein n=1 Tax=Glaciibacter psychrotolerans TaxID=670054 RepID=A0A7Z0EBA9_9MICO|nr:hypothetical protein [Leifsonia psychrotolerans]